MSLISPILGLTSDTPKTETPTTTKLSSGAVALVGSSKNEKLMPKLYAAKEEFDTLAKYDSLFQKSKEYSEYKMACQNASMRLQNEANLALQNEMNSRASNITAITTVLQGTHDCCDLDGNVNLSLNLDKDPAVKVFLNEPLLSTDSELRVCPIACKVKDKLDLHTFDEFRTACKEFIRRIHEANYPSIKNIEVIGDMKSQEYKLVVSLTMGDAFIEPARKCDWPTTYSDFINNCKGLN